MAAKIIFGEPTLTDRVFSVVPIGRENALSAHEIKAAHFPGNYVSDLYQAFNVLIRWKQIRFSERFFVETRKTRRIYWRET